MTPAAPHDADIEFTASGSPEAILAQLRALHDDDKVAEAKSQRWSKIATTAFFIAVGSMFMMFLFGPGTLLLSFGAFPVALYSTYRAKREARSDVEDRKLMAAGQLITTFDGELSKKVPLDTYIDFRGFLKAQRSDGKYVQDWLRLSGAFVDGTRFSLRVTATCKRKERRKRKYTKVKERISEDIEIALKLPASAAMSPELTSSVAERLTGKARVAEFRRVTLNARKATFSLRTPVWQRLRDRTGWSVRARKDVTAGVLIWAMIQSVQSARAARTPTHADPAG